MLFTIIYVIYKLFAIHDMTTNGEISTRRTVDTDSTYIARMNYELPRRVHAIEVPKEKQIVADSRENVRKYLIENASSSPMIPLVDMVFDNLDNDRAVKLFAIAGTESSFGTSGYIATNCNNYFGYLYYGTSRRGCYSSRWDTPEHAVMRFIELEKNGWLDPNNDMKGYCVTNCEHWRTNFNHFYNVFY